MPCVTRWTSRPRAITERIASTAPAGIAPTTPIGRVNHPNRNNQLDASRSGKLGFGMPRATRGRSRLDVMTEMRALSSIERYRFGSFELQPDQRRLLSDGALI